MKQESGEFIGHTFCVHCNSSDNCAVYTEENGKYNGTCFTPGCEKYYDDKALREHGMLEELLDPSGKPKFTASKKEPITFEENKELNSRVISPNELEKSGFVYRGIRAETLNFFGHKVECKDGKPFRIYYPETNPELCTDERLGGLTGYKPRTLPKTFGYGNVGLTGKRNELSGQFRFRNLHLKYILVCLGGENDKAAAHQMLKDGRKQSGYESIPVVAPTVGEGGGVDQIRMQYDFLDQFDNIVLCGDADSAGRAAMEKLCNVLPKDKIKIMNCTLKDPHQMLEKGMQKQFVSDFFNADEYEASRIKDSVDGLSEIKDFLTAPKISLPPYMHRLQDNLRGGIRSTGAIVNIIAATSSGKTLVTDNLLYHWIFNSPLVPTICTLERTAGEMMIDLVSLHMKKNIGFFDNGQEAWDLINSEEGLKAQQEVSVDENGRRRLYLIDEREGDINTLKRQIEKSAKKHGSKLIVIDPLTDLLRSLGLEGQESFMFYQKQMKKEGYVFINVLHTRKTQVDSEGQSKFVTEADALGSSTFVQSADINIVLNRNKNSADPVERNLMHVDVPKVRGGVTGPAAKWYFDIHTRQQVDYEDWKASQPDMSWQDDDSAPAFDSTDSGESVAAEKKETF